MATGYSFNGKSFNGHGKTALITGASMGIGRELAVVFAEHGYDLVVVARSVGKLEELKADLEDGYGINVTVIGMDLAKASAPAKLFKQVQDAGLHIDCLVNNAGFGSFKPFASTARSKITDMVQLNVATLTELTHLFVQPMIKKGAGRVLNVASVAGFNPVSGAAVYGASKAFVLSFSEALSEELADNGIIVTALCPGLTDSEFDIGANGEKPKDIPMASLFLLSARQVAEEGFEAVHTGEAVKVNGPLYQMGVEWMRLTPRSMARKMGNMFTRQMSGF